MENADTANLDQVRDILFGSQTREFNQSLARLDERLSNDIASSRKDAKNRTDSLELYVKNEVQALIERLNDERDKREQSVNELTKQIREFGKETKGAIAALDKRLNKLDEKASKSERTLRQQILDEVTSLRDDLEAKHEDHRGALEREAAMLKDVKVDRLALSDLFNEIALRLAEQQEGPTDQ
jgi:hypothetical protein